MPKSTRHGLKSVSPAPEWHAARAERGHTQLTSEDTRDGHWLTTSDLFRVSDSGEAVDQGSPSGHAVGPGLLWVLLVRWTAVLAPTLPALAACLIKGSEDRCICITWAQPGRGECCRPPTLLSRAAVIQPTKRGCGGKSKSVT